MGVRRRRDHFSEEAARLADDPGIVFRDGPAGRRAALAGHRLDVWQVIETVQHEGGDVEAAAEFSSVSPGLVGAAVSYYARHSDDVDEWIARNAAMAEGCRTATTSSPAHDVDPARQNRR
jgi:uncharacterized protein (DUF433 family)